MKFNRNQRLIIILAVVPMFAGCETMNSPDSNRHVDEILALDEACKQAMASRDVDGMMAIYAPDARELLPDMQPVVGPAAIKEFYRGLFESLPRLKHEYDPDEVIVAESGDLAVVRGKYRFIADANEPDAVQTGKYVGVWRRRDREWRLVMNISNGDPPPGESQ